MAAPPWLSVIVPVLDEAAGIDAFLDALLPLRDGGVEVVVVDGGSRDGTLPRCAGRVDQALAGPRGRARQMNHGAARARGTALLFLHADTRLPDGAAAAVHAALARRAWGRFDVRITGRSAMLPLVAALMNLRSRLSGIATGDQALFVRREAFDAIGGFPDQPLMEDIELCARLRRRWGRPACLRLRVATSGRRWDAHGAWRTIWLMWRLRWRYWRGTAADLLAREYR